MPETLSHHEGQARVIEICAGLIGDEADFADEAIIDCARRELLEETGHSAGQITPLLSSPTSAGMTNETTHLFFARDCVQTAPGGGVDGEDITTHLVPLDELSAFLQKASAQHLLIDFKIHACLGSLTLQGVVL